MRRVLLLIGTLTAGCGGSGGDPYLAALPTRDAVAIRVPGATTGTSGASQQGLLGTQAMFYTTTRQISTEINGDAASLFGMIDTAVASPPTAHDATHEIWGPFTDALSPVTVELGVNLVDAQNYMFYLGGKPKGAPDSAFMPMMGGTAHRVDATHGSGELDINFTNMNMLDPTVNTATGGIALLHDNTADPRTVTVHFGDFVPKPGSTPLNAQYDYAEHADHAGNFTYELFINFDSDPQNVLEDAKFSSRWLGSGAGRTDLVVAGGSLPAGFVVHASECWDASFGRVYYTENVDPTKTEGDPASCALP
jgi:hypothetical protein